MIAILPVMLSCAQADVPGGRNARVPSPTMADERPEAVNEKPDSVLYLPLGSDVLVPESANGNPLPTDEVGPFELRSETLAGALQLILADYEIPMAFETNEGMTRTITVAIYAARSTKSSSASAVLLISTAHLKTACSLSKTRKHSQSVSRPSAAQLISCRSWPQALARLSAHRRLLTQPRAQLFTRRQTAQRKWRKVISSAFAQALR